MPAAQPSVADLYKIALDEYRFQVTLNWSRTQYFIALNIAVVTVALATVASLEGVGGVAASLALFTVGAACCVFGLSAGRTQRGYYHHVRDHKERLEERLGLGELAITTTPGMGGRLARAGKVHTFHSWILAMLLVLDLGGGAAVVGTRLL